MSHTTLRDRIFPMSFPAPDAGIPSPKAPDAGPVLFASRPPASSATSWLPWVIAAAVVLLLAGALLFAGHRTAPAGPSNRVLPLDPYASSVVFTALQMSESTSLSGGKSTFIDGHVRNGGTRTLSGATVQVLFANDEALPPQVATLPLTLIRTREPYIDTQPLAAAPLAPGEYREFRLIFEDIRPNWNGQLPEIHVVRVAVR